MMALLGGALLAGLVGSPHCAGMCGGFAAACSRRPAGALPWHLGRLLTYAALGAVAALAGRALPGPAWVPGAVALVLLVWFAGSLAGLLPEPRLPVPGLAHAGAALAARGGFGWRVLFGMTTGLLPCGLVYAALAVPVSLADPALGALAMLLFGLGTVPALALLAAGLRRLAGSGLAARRAVAALMLGAGLWSLAVRQGVLGAAHAHPAPAAPSPAAPHHH